MAVILIPAHIAVGVHDGGFPAVGRIAIGGVVLLQGGAVSLDDLVHPAVRIIEGAGLAPRPVGHHLRPVERVIIRVGHVAARRGKILRARRISKTFRTITLVHPAGGGIVRLGAREQRAGGRIAADQG